MKQPTCCSTFPPTSLRQTPKPAAPPKDRHARRASGKLETCEYTRRQAGRDPGRSLGWFFGHPRAMARANWKSARQTPSPRRQMGGGKQFRHDAKFRNQVLGLDECRHNMTRPTSGLMTSAQTGDLEGHACEASWQAPSIGDSSAAISHIASATRDL